MKPRFLHYLFAVVLALTAAGCAPPFPAELLRDVDRTLNLERIKGDPGRYRGSMVMLGGMIVGVKNTKEGSFVEVLQRPLDREGRPLATDRSEGRFIARSDRFIDSAVYHAGRDITIVGEVEGEKVLPLGEVDYRYVVVAMRDLHLWGPSSAPRFFFSIGITHQL